MRSIIMIVVVAGIAAAGLMTESVAIMPAKSSVSFSQRWAPVDAALQSGQFVVEQRLDD